jgi:acyl-CoA thioester hydrolase
MAGQQGQMSTTQRGGRRHVYPCRVRWSDVDTYGHVNNVKYFEYSQEARIALLSGLSDGSPQDTGRGVVVARIDVDYRRPILFRSEPFQVETWVSRVGTSSYDLEAEIKDGDEVLSRAHAVVVAFDLHRQRSRPLSEVERARLDDLLVPS